MKYTVLGFYQPNLVENSLDCADAHILRWLLDFIATGKMQRIENDGELYFLVKYEAVAEELPILQIGSVKSLARRFDKYVKSGLLKKRISRGNGLGGAKTFFAPSEKLHELTYKPSENSDWTNLSSQTQKMKPLTRQKCPVRRR